MTCCAADRPRRAAPGAPPALLPWALVLAVLAAALVGCASGGGGPAAAPPPVEALDAGRLLNLQLSPEYSQWLVGPVAALATPEEEQAFLALTEDAEARRFIEEFWQRRDPYPQRPDNPLRERFEERAQVADRLYSEGGYLGRRTARGTLFVLFGEPTRTDYQIAPDPRDPAIEVWYYEGEEHTGLHGRPPAPYYRFIRRGEVTEFYRPRTGIERARPVRPGT